MNAKMRELATIQRIERGIIRDGDRDLKFPETTRNMVGVELEMFWRKINKYLKSE